MHSLIPHPSSADLEAFAVGRLSALAADEVAAHLETCSQCAQTVAGLDNASDALVLQLAELHSYAVELPDARLQGALSFVKAIGRDESQRSPSNGGVPLEPPMLGRLREYELIEKLGEGGMGTVYKARHTKLDKIVALKVLSSDRMGSPVAVARFEREMRAIGRLEHPNLIRAHDAGEVEGTHFLVMEFVDGCDLARLARQRPLGIQDACELVRQAALGLAHVHEHGLVHRDIKPSNLMLSAAGIVKILDLGLARLQDDAVDLGELTAAGQVMGTVDYMAPEQAQSSHEVDIRADLYSLGATLYKLLTGAAPFAGEAYNSTTKKLLAIMTEAPVPVAQRRPDTPAELSQLIDRLLAKNPDERPSTPRELAELLAPFAVGNRIQELASAADQVRDVKSASDTSAYLSSAYAPTKSVAPAPPSISKVAKPSGRPRRVPAGIALGAAGLILAACGIWAIVKDKYGNEVARTKIPPGGSVALVTEESTGLNPIAPKPSTGPAAGGLDKSSVGGDPLSPYALVTRPAKLPGVQSWTIDTRAPRGPVYELKYSPDGKWLAVASDATVRIYDAATGEIHRILLGHRGGPFSVAWHPDSQRIASGGWDAVHIWDVTSAKRIDSVPLKRTDLRCIDWSRDGTKIAVGFALQGVKTGQLLVFGMPSKQVILDKRQRATDIAFSPDGKRLAFCDVPYDPETRIIDATSGETLTAIKRHGRIAWNPSGERLLICNSVYDAEFGEDLLQLDKGGGRYSFSSAAWSPDGKHLAAIDANDRQVWIWNDGDAKSFTLGRIPSLQLDWSSDSRHIAVGAEDGRTQVWDVSTQPAKLSWSIDGHGVWSTYDDKSFRSIAVTWNHKSDSLAAAPTGSAWVRQERVARTWPLNGREPARSIKTYYVQGDWPSWSAGDDQLAICGTYAPKGGILIQSVSDGAVVSTLLDPDKENAEAAAASWAPDGQLIAGFSQNKIRFWRTDGTVHGEPVTSSAITEYHTLAWSPDSRYVATGGRNESPPATVLNVAQRKVIATGMHALRLAWAQDSERLALGSLSSVAIWRPLTGESIKQPRRVSALGWRRDADVLMALVWDGQAHAFVLEHLKGNDLQSLKRIADLPSDLGQYAGQFSPDGKWLATTYGNTIWLFATDDGRAMGTLVALDQGRNLVISPDGHFRDVLGANKELVYVVTTGEGQQLYSPEEFAHQFGWKNDPSQVRLLGSSP